jgi:molybdopterin-binding protein/molybdate transport repressor ModE-like protein
MTRDVPVLAAVDVALLDLLSRESSVVAACERLGISRDRGVYRLRRLGEALGRPVVESSRGGRGQGRTRLTPEGRALLARGVGAQVRGSRTASRAPPQNQWRGRWSASPHPNVAVPGGLRLWVDFVARERESILVAFDPDAVLVAREEFPTSARNVLAGRVAKVRNTGPGTGGERRVVEVKVGPLRVAAAVTDSSVQALQLTRGRRVVLYVKATAVRRADVPGRAVIP